MIPTEEAAYLRALANTAATDTRLSERARLVVAAWLDGHARQIEETTR